MPASILDIETVFYVNSQGELDYRSGSRIELVDGDSASHYDFFRVRCGQLSDLALFGVLIDENGATDHSFLVTDYGANGELSTVINSDALDLRMQLKGGATLHLARLVASLKVEEIAQLEIPEMVQMIQRSFPGAKPLNIKD